MPSPTLVLKITFLHRAAVGDLEDRVRAALAVHRAVVQGSPWTVLHAARRTSRRSSCPRWSRTARPSATSAPCRWTTRFTPVPLPPCRSCPRCRWCRRAPPPRCRPCPPCRPSRLAPPRPAAPAVPVTPPRPGRARRARRAAECRRCRWPSRPNPAVPRSGGCARPDPVLPALPVAEPPNTGAARVTGRPSYLRFPSCPRFPTLRRCRRFRRCPSCPRCLPGFRRLPVGAARLRGGATERPTSSKEQIVTRSGASWGHQSPRLCERLTEGPGEKSAVETVSYCSRL